MRLALGLREINEANLRFARQLGVTHLVVPTPDAMVDGRYDFQRLLRMRTFIESFGLKFAAIQNFPAECYDRIRFGLPGRDEQLDLYRQSLRNIGAAGIPIVGYNFHAYTVWRTGFLPIGRGGASYSLYDHELGQRVPTGPMGEIGEEEMWANYEYFLKAVIPVAEEAGVKMALHPDDPPLSPLAGAPCLFRSVQSYERAFGIVESEHNGMLLCQGCFAEMGEDVPAVIRRFGARGKIQYVHFRNVRGSMPYFEEVFIDEGDVDMYECLLTYKEVGFTGPFIPDHLPGVEGDSAYRHRSAAYALGYMKALLKVADAEA